MNIEDQLNSDLTFAKHFLGHIYVYIVGGSSLVSNDSSQIISTLIQQNFGNKNKWILANGLRQALRNFKDGHTMLHVCIFGKHVEYIYF